MLTSNTHQPWNWETGPEREASTSRRKKNKTSWGECRRRPKHVVLKNQRCTGSAGGVEVEVAPPSPVKSVQRSWRTRRRVTPSRCLWSCEPAQWWTSPPCTSGCSQTRVPEETRNMRQVGPEPQPLWVRIQTQTLNRRSTRREQNRQYFWSFQVFGGTLLIFQTSWEQGLNWFCVGSELSRHSPKPSYWWCWRFWRRF